MTDFTGGSGTDVFIGSESADNASGGGGNDSLIGNGGDDILAGDDGADYLEGGAGNDFLYGGGLSGFFNEPYSNNPWTAPTLDTGSEQDTLLGGNGYDKIFAGYGDTVDGGSDSSNDTLYISFMGGGAGVTINFNNSSFTIGGGTIQGIESIAWVQGSDFDDHITMTSNGYSSAPMFGMGGNDTLIAAYYTQYLDGGDGNDVVDGRASQYLQTVIGGSGDDTLYTNSGSSIRALGGDGNDTIHGNGYLNGGAGNDTIWLEFTYYSSVTHGDGGDDIIHASDYGSTDTYGDDGADQLIGGAGFDILTGGAGNDILSGGGQSYGSSYYSGDLAVYSGNHTDYQVTRDPNTLVVTVTDLRGGSPDGTDTLTGIEILRFANATYSVEAMLSGQASGVQNFIGTPNADIYYGSEDANTAIGYASGDTFYGFGDGDKLVGGGGADYLDGGIGNDTLYSGDATGSFNAPYYGNPWNAPTLDTGAEQDTLIGGDGSDAIFAGYGDNVDGGSEIGLYPTGDSLYISFLGAASGVIANFSLSSLSVGGGTITGIENVNWVQGSNFDDQITLGRGNGYGAFTPVFGMGGDDTLIAGYYTGYLDGGDGNDVVDGRGSQYLQAVIGGAGDDTLYTSSGSSSQASGGDGNDTIYGSGYLSGGAGNDTFWLEFPYYSGTTHGDDGDDVIHASAYGSSQIYGDAGNDSFFGGDGNDGFNGGGGSDTIVGGAGADTLDGGDDEDTIDGGTGSNTLSGGNGNDRLILGAGSDGTVVDGGAGTDTLVVNAAITPSGAIGGIEAIEFNSGSLTISSSQATGLPATTAISGTGSMTVNQQPNIAVNLSGYTFAVGANVAFTINGSALDDTAQAANAATLLNGGNGNDSLYGGSAGDTLDGGAGVNLLDGGGGNDRLVVATAGSGTSVNGGSGTDTLAVSGTVTLGTLAGLEAIELVGGATLTLTAAQFNAGFYNPIAQVGMANVSGTGSLILNLDPNPVTAALYLTSLSFVPGSSVTLTINGTSGLDAIKGAPGVSNIINGGDEADQIRGGSLADTIDGGNGNDKLFGWSGADVLTGGAGSDQFRYFFATDSGTGAAADRITDFQIGTDKFNFVIIDADPVTPDDQAFAFIGTGAFTSPGTGQIRYQDSGADLLVQVDVDGNGTVDMEVVLQGLAGQALTSGDFML